MIGEQTMVAGLMQAVNQNREMLDRIVAAQQQQVRLLVSVRGVVVPFQGAGWWCRVNARCGGAVSVRGVVVPCQGAG